MVKLRCPICHASHWEIDSDYRGADLGGGVELPYPERDYFCPLQEDWTWLRSSSEVPARVFPSATRAVSDERKRLRVLGKNLEAELSRQSNAG